MHCIVYDTEIEFQFQPHLTFSDLLPAVRLTCVGPISPYAPLQLLALLSCPNPGLWQTLTCYPSSLLLCLSNLHVSPTMALVQAFSSASLCSSWTINPFPTSLTLFYSPNSSDTPSLISHLSLPPSSSSNGQQSPAPFPPFPPWRAAPLNPGTADFSIPLSPGRFLQMCCVIWMRQEWHQQCLENNLTGRAF